MEGMVFRSAVREENSEEKPSSYPVSDRPASFYRRSTRFPLRKR